MDNLVILHIRDGLEYGWDAVSIDTINALQYKRNVFAPLGGVGHIQQLPYALTKNEGQVTLYHTITKLEGGFFAIVKRLITEIEAQKITEYRMQTLVNTWMITTTYNPAIRFFVLPLKITAEWKPKRGLLKIKGYIYMEDDIKL